MADGSGGGEGGRSSECLPMDELLEAMLRNGQALAEAVAADRARREAADRIQRESWEAALKEKDAEIHMLRAEGSDAKKKLQADASRKMRWDAAYELLLGANQKLAELRDADMEDSRTCAETPNSKGVERYTRLNQNTTDHIATDLRAEIRKLKKAYKTLSSKKDKEVSALLSEKDSVSNQLSIMQQDYANKKVEAALKLQQSVDELKVLARKKDDEIGRLHSLVKEKDVEIQRLKGRHLVRSKSINNGLRQVVEDCSSQKETAGEDGQDETRPKRRRVSSISKSGSDEDDDEKSGSDEDDHEQSGSDGDEQSGSDENGEEQSRSYEHEQSVSDDQETMNYPVQKPLGNPKRKRDPCNARVTNGKATVKAMVRTQWYWSYMAPAPLCSHTRNVRIHNGRRFVVSTGNWAQYVRDVKVILADQPDKHKEFVRFLCNFENWRIEDVARTMAALLDGHSELICRFNRFLPKYWQIEIEEEDEERHPEESAVAAAGLIKLKEAEQQPNQVQL